LEISWLILKTRSYCFTVKDSKVNKNYKLKSVEQYEFYADIFREYLLSATHLLVYLIKYN
jgi:hypothetical protein